MSQRAAQQAHLGLQIIRLNKTLQLQRLICARLNIREASQSQEVAELSSAAAVGNIAHE